MSDEQSPISIVRIDAARDYANIRPFVQAACRRPQGSYEVIAALAALIGDVIGGAPTDDLKFSLEEDVKVIIKKHIILALSKQPPPLVMPDAQGTH